MSNMRFMLFLVLLGLFFPVFAQKEANIWYFGLNAGIDFNQDPPVALIDSKLSTAEGCATICDKNGNLQLYTDGTTVWTHDHSIMANGTNLKGHPSSSNSAVVVPWPQVDNKYIVFTVGVGLDPVYYSVVDMSANNGLGEVIQKNVFMTDNTAEKVSAILKNDGSGYWIGIARILPDSTAEYLIYSVDSQGVNLTNVQTYKTANSPGRQIVGGVLKFSPDGTKMAAAMNQYIELLDFDNSTGQLSNPIKIYGTASGIGFYGIEFSPDSKVLYACKAMHDETIFQYDLTKSSANEISNSISIFQAPNALGLHYTGAFQSAPNGKIYVAVASETNMTEITNPNVLGSGCNIVWDGLDLKGKMHWAGLPSFIQSTFKSGFTIVADPGTNTTFQNDTTIKISVFSKSVELTGVDIHYTTDGSSPAGANAKKYTSPFTINSSLTLKVFVEKNGFESDSAEFKYVKFGNPDLEISAHPGDNTTFYTDTTIALTVKSQGIVISGAEIYYTLDGSDPTGATALKYTNPLLIDKSVNLKVYAVKTGYNSDTAQFSYTEKTKPVLEISADPGDNTTFYTDTTIALTVKSQGKVISGTEIFYTLDGSDPTNANALKYTKPFLIDKSVTLKVYAVKTGYDSDTAQFEYFIKVPTLIITADPGNSSKFLNSINITLSVTSSNNLDVSGAKIYYTINGPDPTIQDQLYTDAFQITSDTVIVKAIAIKDGYKQGEGIWVYYRIPNSIVGATYFDKDGNGGIDSVLIKLDGIPNNLPDDFSFINPFNTEDTTDNIQTSWLNGDSTTQTLSIVLNDYFDFSGSTDFKQDSFGHYNSNSLVNGPFKINDGIAPVIKSSVYAPGGIRDKSTLTYNDDTLFVIFSESVTNVDIINGNPFKFNNGLTYTFSAITSSSDNITFALIIKQSSKPKLPQKNDSIWINSVSNIVDAKGNVQKVKDNRRVRIIVKERPYLIEIKSLSPFTPLNSPIPAEIKSTGIKMSDGMFITINFYSDVSSVLKSIECIVYDAVGNVIIKTDELENSDFEISTITRNSVTNAYLCWNGKNRNNRIVGSGSYLAILKIYFSNGESVEKGINIGVKN